jgi:hypothetical protein
VRVIRQASNQEYVPYSVGIASLLISVVIALPSPKSDILKFLSLPSSM